ncbi:MAG: LexA family protein [Prevotella sp.]
MTELFYPDWIICLNDGTIGIFDTKAGFTAASIETKCKAEALHKKIRELNDEHSGTIRYVGGIIRKENGVWYYNDNEIYVYQKGCTKGWKLLSSLFGEVESEKVYLPLYPFHMACGLLESGDALAEDGVERWIDVSSCGFKPNDNMFVVYAKGDSMKPKIHDGDLCVFERYTGGSREGDIVLAQISGQDDDYLCKYTIKKYHSEKIVSDDSWEYSRIELLPINTDGYNPIVLDDVENYRVLGVLRYVISD